MEEKAKLYRIQADKLRSYPEFLKNFNATLNWEQGKGLTLTHEGFDDKTISAVFMAVRPFLMKQRINFEELCKDIIASDRPESMKKDANDVLEAWNQMMHPQKDSPLMQIDEKGISYLQNFKFWMNEEHFHPEEYKVDGSRGLSSIKQFEPLEWFSKPFMVDFLQKIVQLILWLDIRVILKIDQESIRIIKKHRNPTKEAADLKKALEKKGVRVLVELHDGHKHIDLAIPKAKINVEVDGIQHLTNPEQIVSDLSRGYYSHKNGFDTMHIPNEMIRLHLEEISTALAEASKIRERKIHLHLE